MFRPQSLRLGFLLLLVALFASFASSAAERAKTEAELKAIASQIEKVRQQVRQDAVERDKLSRDLASAEGSVARARGEIDRLRRERADREKARAALAAEKARSEAEVGRQREALAAQLRAAYQTGPQEPLRLLLNQQDAGRVERTLTYYGYFGRARAEQVGKINVEIAKIDEATAKITAEDEELKRLEAQRKAQLGDLEDARRQRSKVLADLQSESKDRQASLKRLQTQQGALEKLLKELDRALKSYPVAPIDPNDAFAKLRGQLAWPVAGKLSARFGEERAGGVRWNGMLISAERGAPVQAIHPGRVAYADWLPGLGLLLIVDHGNGYLSLYGHNDRLFKAAGASVRAGETVAAAGDSGGRGQTALYFEIRRAGKPVDPGPWLRGRTPPAP
ncbi:MAG: peptidoglycan DD-metalloendopeptidase family protein [Steroidobacteraceae bacterium]